jgi:hypothetical protein
MLDQKELLTKRDEKKDEIDDLNFQKLHINDKGIHYFKDDNKFTPLIPKVPERLSKGHYFSIMFDSRTSAKVNKISESIYRRNGLLYFNLVPMDGFNRFLLKKNNDGRLVIPDGRYMYIITQEGRKCEMRVGVMPHYYLNDKRYNHLIIAGEIEFARNGAFAEVVSFNDQSGGYHIKEDDSNLSILKINSIEDALVELKLPMANFKKFSATLKKLDQRRKTF